MKAFDMLKQIIKPQYAEYFKDWIDTANDQERRGLQLISAIFKNKGRKKFRAKPPTEQLKELQKQQELTFKKAEEMFRKKQVTSTYGMEFGYLKKDLKPTNNILVYKKCSQLEISEPLNNLTVQFIDNWIELNDELEFQELILACLRSMYSRVKAQDVPKSEQKTVYHWNKVDWNLVNPVRVDKIGQELKAYKTNYNAIFKQRLKQEQLNQQFKDLEEKEGKEYLNSILKKSFKI